MGIVPHLSLKGKSHGFSRVVAGTSGIFSSLAGWHFNNRVSLSTSALMSSYDGFLRNLS